ncbi:SEC-C metal-binding domain-containing protein [Paenibacillus methanolicus]|nr:SEC-C metal-binding domain-containing protein [Paenibacillus methanolicus]
MPLLLERLKQSKPSETIHWFHAYRFPQTEETLRELLALWQSPSIDPNTKHHLRGILLHSEPRLLTPYEALIAKDAIWSKRVRQKRGLAMMDDRELMDVFRVFIEQSAGKYVDEFDANYGDEIVLELSRRKCMTNDAVLQKLAAYDPSDISYETAYYTKLAGARKLEAAIPYLCDVLGADDDWHPERAKEALVQIGTTSVITMLTERYAAAESEYFRMYASDVFGRIKLPASEEALLTLLPEEQDLSYATTMADGLCQLGSSKGFPMVQTMVEAGNYERGLMNLTESIYTYCVISNTPHPSLSQWKQELNEEEARTAKHGAAWERMFADAGIPEGFERFQGGIAKPYTNPAKVGRNDPCPCGSGKKHKKCCGA